MTFGELGPLPRQVEVECRHYPHALPPEAATHVHFDVRIRGRDAAFLFSDRAPLVDLTERRDFEITTGRVVADALAAWLRFEALRREAQR